MKYQQYYKRTHNLLSRINQLWWAFQQALKTCKHISPKIGCYKDTDKKKKIKLIRAQHLHLTALQGGVWDHARSNFGRETETCFKMKEGCGFNGCNLVNFLSFELMWLRGAKEWDGGINNHMRKVLDLISTRLLILNSLSPLIMAVKKKTKP